MVENPNANCPVKPGLIIRGSDGQIYQITKEQLQQYLVTRKDEHMDRVEEILENTRPNSSNVLCLDGEFEELRNPVCCAHAVLQIKDVLGGKK